MKKMAMIRFNRLCLLCYWVVFVCVCVRVRSQRCSKTLRNGTIQRYCCDNTMEIDGKCIGCDAGYISDFGEPCHRCPDGNFGEKCADICNCHEHERCQHVVGCVDFTVSSTSSTHDYTLERTTSKSSEEKVIETVKTEVIIYIICTVSIIVVILMCRIYTCYGRRIKHPAINDRKTRGGQSNMENTQSVVNERIYDSIDESEMIDMAEQSIFVQCEGIIRLSKSSSSSMTDNSENLSGDGYLNPYQPMDHILGQHHCYYSLNKDTFQNINSSALKNKIDTFDTFKIQIENKALNKEDEVEDIEGFDQSVDIKTNLGPINMMQNSPPNIQMAVLKCDPANGKNGENEYSSYLKPIDAK